MQTVVLMLAIRKMPCNCALDCIDLESSHHVCCLGELRHCQKPKAKNLRHQNIRLL